MEEIKNRKTTRLQGFDYNRSGAFFLTVCTENRRCVLSNVVGTGVPDGPSIELLPYGKIAEKYIKQLDAFYDDVSVRSYVIMPNHIHLLLSVMKDNGRGNPSPTVDTAMGWLKYQITKEINILRGTPGEKLLQRSFFDHIIRNQDDYYEIYKYIYENPLRWKLDKFYAEEWKHH